MPNQLSGQTGPSPQSHRKHVRHALFARDRHSQQFLAFLAYLAAKFTANGTATTEAQAYALVELGGAIQCEAVANAGGLPATIVANYDKASDLKQYP